MSLRKIARLGNPILRTPARPVPIEDIPTEAIQREIDDMIETMRDGDGVGLAAPQVHISKRIILVEVRPCNPRYPAQAGIPLQVIINPVIEQQGSTVHSDWEGCLSIPDLRGLVPRSTSITLNGYDREGNRIRLVANDFHARIILHEIDHLDGLNFLDRMDKLDSLTFLREYQMYWQK